MNPSFEVLVINNTGDDFSGKYVTACLYPSFPAGRDFLDYFKDPALDPDDLQSDLIAVNEQLFDSAIKELPLYPPGISGTEWYVPGNYVLCVYVEMDVSVEGENRSDLPSPGDYVYSRSITVDELLQDELVLLEDDDVWSIFRLTVAYPDDPEEDVGGCELEAGYIQFFPDGGADNFSLQSGRGSHRPHCLQRREIL